MPLQRVALTLHDGLKVRPPQVPVLRPRIVGVDRPTDRVLVPEPPQGPDGDAREHREGTCETERVRWRRLRNQERGGVSPFQVPARHRAVRAVLEEPATAAEVVIAVEVADIVPGKDMMGDNERRLCRLP